MKKIYLLLLLSSSLFHLPALLAQTWNQKTDFAGSARRSVAAFAIGTKGYFGTGHDAVELNDFWEWDQPTNTWSQKADFPGLTREYAVGFSIGTKGYIGTGYHNANPYFQKDFYEWDQATNTWTRKADFGGVIRDEAVGFSIGAKGYIGTGADNGNKNDFWEWDQATDTWTQKAVFSGGARYAAVAFSIGTKGYIGTGAPWPYKKDFWEWNQATNTWTQKAIFPGTAREFAVGVSCNGKGYIGTGVDQNIVYYKDMWEYDPTGNAWTKIADFGGTARLGAAAFAIGTCIYVGTGIDPALQKDLWEYCPGGAILPPAAGFRASDSVFCANDCISFTNLSSNGTSYQWFFEGASPSSSSAQSPQNVCYTSSGAYDVKLIATNSGGSDSVTFSYYIDVKAAPPTPVITPTGTTLYCSTDPSYSSYQWYDDTTLIPGATDTSLVISHGGNYNVQVSNEDGCKIAVGINVVLGEQPFTVYDLQFTVYPNPVSDELTIAGSWKMETGNRKLTIFNVLGEKVYSLQSEIKNSKSEIPMDVSTLQPGIYFVQVISEHGSWVEKFIKE